MELDVYGGRELPLQIFKSLGISFVIFFYFDLFLMFLFKIKASESKMENGNKMKSKINGIKSK